MPIYRYELQTPASRLCKGRQNDRGQLNRAIIIKIIYVLVATHGYLDYLCTQILMQLQRGTARMPAWPRKLPVELKS